jgi:hypothetical protein
MWVSNFITTFQVKTCSAGVKEEGIRFKEDRTRL